MNTLLKILAAIVLFCAAVLLLTYEHPADAVIPVSRLNRAREIAQAYPAPAAKFQAKLDAGTLTYGEAEALRTAVEASPEFRAKAEKAKREETDTEAVRSAEIRAAFTQPLVIIVFIVVFIALAGAFVLRILANRARERECR